MNGVKYKQFSVCVCVCVWLEREREREGERERKGIEKQRDIDRKIDI